LGIQRLRSQSALAESEAHLRTITDHNPSAIIVLDADQGRFIEANGTAERITGYPREELFRRGPLETSPPFQPDGRPTGDVAKELIEKVLTTGHATFEWISRSASGVDFPTETRAARIPIPGRNLIVASMVDITARKEAEAELTRALAREKELSELKSNFVSMVSHEFRTPLEIIISSADNLQRYHDRLPSEKRQQLLQSIHKAVRRMSGMMEEVLVLGRLETDRLTFSPAPIELSSFFQRLCDEIESATNRRCPIALHLEGSMEGASGDESLLRHIFTNLLSNAVKYSPTGQGVEFHVHRQGDQAICRVIDHGCGIPETDQKMLFQAFHRGSNVGQVPGTGLGLLIVRRCVELQGGDIHFASTEGQGAAFTVHLPLFAPLPARSEPAAIDAVS
jgi:PAS domain S-box-containing protein